MNFSETGILDFCEGCVKGKMSRKSFKPVGGIKSTRKLQLVHSDVCWSMPESIGGRKYSVTFVDDYSRCTAVYFLKQKFEVMQKFIEFEAAATNKCGQRIGTLKSDNGGEYLSHEFKSYLKSKGIKHETTVAHSPQQNGVAERMNRTLLESARAMVYHAGLGKFFWAEGVSTAAYIRNRVTTTTSGQTPYERWYGRIPDVFNFRVFGCMAYAHIPEVERTKLDKKTIKLRFLGYSDNQKGYRLYDMNRRKVIVRRDVVFNETDFGHQSQPLRVESEADAEAQQPPVVSEDSVSETSLQQEPPQRSEKATKGQPPLQFVFDEYAEVTDMTHIALHAAIKEPSNIQEALGSKYSKQWKAAADSQYQSLMENKTWQLVELPVDRTAIGCKWVFKVKYGEQEEVERFKGRLVAKGYWQKYGIHYDETFSPVVRFNSIRALLAYAVQNRMLIHQMDVVTAFLNGELEEKIYMQQPEGYVRSGNENLVCKLKKSINGLKQSPRCWNQAFKKLMESLDFKQSQAGPCIFIKGSEADKLTIIAVYVDDLIIITSTEEQMNQIKASLSKHFKMKDMKSLHFCLGVHVKQSEEGVKLSQKQYIEKLLQRYGLQDANPVSTPVDLYGIPG